MKKWWVQDWLDLLDSYRFKKRLERARDYARQGNVLSCEFQETKLIARVKGNFNPEYSVSLWLDAFSDEQWDDVIESMSKQAIFAAQLLAGEMPDNIKDLFTYNGLSLFPFTLSEVRSYCSCPDQQNPCKHVGAIYYILSDRFSDDPFIIFQLRGRSREQIIQALRSQRPITLLNETSLSDLILDHQTPSDHQSNSLLNFWTQTEPFDSTLIDEIITSSNPSHTLKLLGSLGEDESQRFMLLAFEQMYQNNQQAAIATCLKLN